MAAEDTERDTLGRIQFLVDEEHRLREHLQQQHGDSAGDHERLRSVEVELDRCWDLLRQRRALRDAGGDPGAAEIRPAAGAEGYLS